MPTLTLPDPDKTIGEADHTPDHNMIVQAIIDVNGAIPVVLPVGDAVPGGTPVGTLIVRY